MNKINLLLLVIISAIAGAIDSYALYILFMMTAMPIGFYLSPFLLLFLVLLIPSLFISAIVGIYNQKRWAYWAFFIITVLLIVFLLFVYIYMYSFGHKHLYLGAWQFFLIAFALIFPIYFLLPSTRRIFVN